MHIGKGMLYGGGCVLCFWFLGHSEPSLGQVKAKESVPNSQCITLSEAVSAALNSSETLKIQSSEALIASEQYSSAKAAVLPSVKASAVISKQDTSQITSRATPEAYPTTAKLTLSQPLYAGGAEYAALRKTSTLLNAGEKQSEAARIKVVRDVVSKTFLILVAQAELQSSTELRDLSRRRFKEIRGRVAIGRSKAADGLGAEVQVANSDAQYESARLALETAKRQLATSIGRDFDNVCAIPPKTDVSLKSWSAVQEKVLQRPDLMAADLNSSAASENVAMARAGHQPSLELGANYYFKRPQTQKTSGNWDLALSASVPLYSGGMVSSKVNEALALEQKQFALSRQTKKMAEDEARELWESYQTGRAQLSSLDDAAKKSAQYYQAMASDERKGLASSLETLQALNSSIDSQRAAQKAKFKFDETLRQLELVMGNIEGALQ